MELDTAEGKMGTNTLNGNTHGIQITFYGKKV